MLIVDWKMSSAMRLPVVAECLIDRQLLLCAPAAGLRARWPNQSRLARARGERRRRAGPTNDYPRPPPIRTCRGIGGRGIEIDHDSVRGLDPRPEEKEAALALGHRRRIFADRFRSSIEKHHASVVAIDIAVEHTGRHAGDFIDHPHGQGAVDVLAFWQDQIPIPDQTGLDFRCVRGRQEPTDGTGSARRWSRWEPRANLSRPSKGHLGPPMYPIDRGVELPVSAAVSRPASLVRPAGSRTPIRPAVSRR